MSVPPSPPPIAVAVTGMPGAGKSTVARALARRLLTSGQPLALLDQDTLTGPLTSVVAVQAGVVAAGELPSLDHPVLRALTRDATYEVLLATAADILGTGLGCMLVAPFTSQRQDPTAWHAVVERLLAAGAREVVLVVVGAAPTVVRDRLVSRGSGRDRDRVADPAGLLAAIESEAARPVAVPHVRVDSGAGLGPQIEALAVRLTR